MNDEATARLCRELIAVADEAINADARPGFQSRRHFGNIYEGLCNRAESLAPEAAARKVDSRPFSALPPRRLHSGDPCKAEEIAAIHAVKAVANQLLSVIESADCATANAPAGWFFKAQPPNTLEDLIAWLAQRTAWMHENIVNRFPPGMGEAIVREYPAQKPIDTPREMVLLYARGIVANVRFWLDHHGIVGQPNCTVHAEGPRELIELDEYLSELLAFVRSLTSSVIQDGNSSVPRAAREAPDDPITLGQMTRIGMMGNSTVRNWGTSGRPLPHIQQRGKRAAIYSYRDLRDWFISRQPDKASNWPEEYDEAMATWTKLSNK